jgi:hypothetical protein
MVFSPFLNVDDKDLLQPKRQLHKAIPLKSAGDVPGRPIRPDLLKIEPVL